MSIHSVTIDFDDMQLAVTLDHSPLEAPSCDCPGQPESWDIVSVTCDGEDMMPALTARDLVRIKATASSIADGEDEWVHPAYERYEALREAIEWAGGPVIRG